MLNCLTIVGARPQFIKAAVLSRAFKQQGAIVEKLIHTGQHYDPMMSQVFFDELGMSPPDYHFQVQSKLHGAMTANMLTAIEEVLLAERPDFVLVYGDTNSTLAGALAASKLSIPIVHIEAGLRSFQKNMPEEINRVLTDHLSRVCFCPTTASVAHLKQEGITRQVYLVGDVMYDAVCYIRSQIQADTPKQQTPEPYAIATLHRQENTDDMTRLHQMIDYLKQQAHSMPLILYCHPRTADRCKKAAIDFGNISLQEPVGYLEMQRSLMNASTVYTDSGGLQKEAYFHRVPCVTLRDHTEWVETIDAGWNRLWTQAEYQRRSEITDYGDGHAANKMIDVLMEYFNR